MRHVAWLLLLAACSGARVEQARLEVRDSIRRLVNPPRGVAFHVWRIGRWTGEPAEDGRYHYRGAGRAANFYVQESVRELGRVPLPTTTQLTNAVDALLYVAAHDPTPLVRATACTELGRIATTLPAAAVGASNARTDAAINALARRLKRHKQEAQVVDALRKLAALDPPGFLAARRMVRAVGSGPVAGSQGAIASEAQRLVPRVVRRCILAALADLSTGREEIDPAPLVRQQAAAALAALGSPSARRGAIRRLRDPVDPAERDPDVRRVLLRYLAGMPGPVVFDACVESLHDLDSGVRYHACLALWEMTGARVRSTPWAWRAWRDAHPAWQLTSTTHSP